MAAITEKIVCGPEEEKKESQHTVVGMYIVAATMENNVEVPQRIESRGRIWSSGPTWGQCWGLLSG